ncbi:ATP-binding protein [Cognatishimia sp. WU-CL00825]|uniref:ATP-binding protein n=1 Tax=Cognatishimia sp. WU-CL00825 TaxID=3127658 RepID=UPI0033655F73
MKFAWLKRYVPRGLYGRAALILILPVVTLQLVVSVIFIQRHFEDVTSQMTRALSGELIFVLDGVAAQASPEAVQKTVFPVARSLGLDPSFRQSETTQNQRRWYDFSGTVVMRELQAEIEGIQAIELPDDKLARVIIDTQFGPLEIGFDRERVSASNPHQLLVNLVFFGILITFIAFLYLRNQLRPITRLAAAAEAFGRGRHVPYSPAGAIEVRAAGSAFLDMRARIERQIEQRTLLLSGVSHDLRTPLTRLRLGLAMLEDEDRHALEQEVEDMQHMLDGFLSFARGASELTAEPVDLCGFLAEIIEKASAGRGTATLAHCDVEAEVLVKKMVVQRALGNLINNAFRYGTTVHVSAMQMKRSIVLRVEDNGPGIPEDKREEAMKPFARLEPARNQNKGSGVGLGLAIAADAARAHGGMLRLDRSEKLGGLQADIVIAI